MIELQKISKIYRAGKEKFAALDGVDLFVGEGEFVAVRGPSGCGKSTLLNLIGLLDKPTSGKLTLFGEDVFKKSDAKRAKLRGEKIGFVLQDFALLPDQTLLYNVMLPLLFGKGSYFSARARAKKALEQVGLGALARKKANGLSGGQRQRVAIARALVKEPALLLADEPTGQLDSATGKEIMEILTACNRRGITVILVTHDDAVASYALRTVSLADGKIVSDTAVKDPPAVPQEV